MIITPDYRYDLQVVRVIDGDTIDAILTRDIGFRHVATWRQRLRLLGVDCPEITGTTRAAGTAAIDDCTTAGAMTDCPHCSGPGRVIESKRCRNGSNRRRHECKDCGNRWTTHKGEPPEQKYRPTVSTGPLSCHQCQQWRQDRCRMGFPDPVAEGPGFANDCLTFMPLGGAKTTSSTR